MRPRRKTWQPTPGYTTVDQVAAILLCLMIAVVCTAAIWWMVSQ